MERYKQIVNDVMYSGTIKENRTGVKTKTSCGFMFKHWMGKGFPLVTTKLTPLKLVCAELEMFIKGISDKKFLHERGCHIWDEWSNPDNPTNKNDLGRIYGVQWRDYRSYNYSDFFYPGAIKNDQLKNIVTKLKENPDDRRMVCTAWNPGELNQMALPPCHLLWQVVVTKDDHGDNVLNLHWYQRSVDVMLGLPFNIASYAMLLLLLCKESKMRPGYLTGFLADTHIYENHFEAAEHVLRRTPFPASHVDLIGDGKSIFDWGYEEYTLNNYRHHPHIKMDVAI